jgi:MurNAc alpha-1-phosphate uridylyltransferase
MKAMILAAGLGTRLRPLTESKPKALVEICGRPILEIIIRQLIKYGFRDVIINTHHHYDQIIDFLKTKNNFGINIRISDEKEQVLDTGGGIKNASWFLDGDEPFLVHNVDVLSDIDLKGIYDYHVQRHPLVTLAVKGKNSVRSLLIDATCRLYGWENTDTVESKIVNGKNRADLSRIGFCGIHVIDPEIFNYFGENKVFSIITTYMEVVGKCAIYGYPVEDNLWIDIGSVEQLEYAQNIDPELYLN